MRPLLTVYPSVHVTIALFTLWFPFVSFFSVPSKACVILWSLLEYFFSFPSQSSSSPPRRNYIPFTCFFPCLCVSSASCLQPQCDPAAAALCLQDVATHSLQLSPVRYPLHLVSFLPNLSQDYFPPSSTSPVNCTFHLFLASPHPPPTHLFPFFLLLSLLSPP